MSVTEFRIGIELEGYWKGKASHKLGGDYAGRKAFAVALASHYNEIRKGMLKVDFSNGPHPGHSEVHNKEHRWRVTKDDGIGDGLLDSSLSEKPEGCTYSKTLCGVTVFIRLTTIQIRLNLSLIY